MKYKLTKEALKMKVNTFAINFGINTKDAVKAFATGEIEIDDPDILAGLKSGILVSIGIGETDEDGNEIVADVYASAIEQKEKSIKKESLK